MYAVIVIIVEATSSFQVPGGQLWPLRKSCAQEALPLLAPRNRNLPLLACRLASACLPSPWGCWQILAVDDLGLLILIFLHLLAAYMQTKQCKKQLIWSIFPFW